MRSFSCCWKDVRLKRARSRSAPRLSIVSVVVERMYDWSFIMFPVDRQLKVSVVVERMYDWSQTAFKCQPARSSFSCCWKDVRLKPKSRRQIKPGKRVSVVVERMYDWSGTYQRLLDLMYRFQLLLKGCTIEATYWGFLRWCCEVSVVVERMYDWSCMTFVTAKNLRTFQLLLKGCTIEAKISSRESVDFSLFQLLLKGCTIEAWTKKLKRLLTNSFSCCWKDVRLKPHNGRQRYPRNHVSVVVERMYDWSCKRTGPFCCIRIQFQLLLKGCTIEALDRVFFACRARRFSCCWKDVRLKLTDSASGSNGD